MISSAKLLRSKGAADLKGRWGEAALLTFVYVILSSIFSGVVVSGTELFVPYVGQAFTLLLLPMSWGLSIAFLDNHRKADDPFNINQLFRGYSDFWRIMVTCLLLMVYTVLWSLLFIVPGIIKSLSYSLTSYILRDRPDLRNNGAIELSMDMMQGHKAELFLLLLSFFGWFLLCIPTLFIGLFWLTPYIQSTMANFYEEVKTEYKTRSIAKPLAKAKDDFSGYSKIER